jgi:hypothetical protein
MTRTRPAAADAGGSRRRHVFVVNSFITYLCARGAMLRCGTPDADALLMLTRPLDAGASLERRDLTARGAPPAGRLRPSPNVIAKRRLLAGLDRLIDATCPGAFHLYVPNTRMGLFTLLSTHPRCDGFSHLEEGVAAHTRGALDFVPPAKARRGPARRMLDAALARACFGARWPAPPPFFDAGHAAAYCFADGAFVGQPRRTALDLRDSMAIFLRDDAKIGRFDDVEPEGVVFIFDGRRPDAADFSAAFRAFCASLRRTGRRMLWFKRHPAHVGAAAFDTFLARAAADAPHLAFAELPQDLCLEALAMRRPDVAFVCDISSAAIYVQLLGAPTYRLRRAAEAELERVLSAVPLWSGGGD